jgi:hydrogenase maturation protease
MRAALIALGNPYRRDDGAAQRVLDLLGPVAGASVISLIQLTPEIGEEIAAMDLAVFIDADVAPGEARIEPVGRPAGSPNPLAHAMGAEEVVEIARRLFDFAGRALLCRIPGFDFSEGEGLSGECERQARSAASLLANLLAESAA